MKADFAFISPFAELESAHGASEVQSPSAAQLQGIVNNLRGFKGEMECVQVCAHKKKMRD
jgi:hypothetical protein